MYINTRKRPHILYAIFLQDYIYTHGEYYYIYKQNRQIPNRFLVFVFVLGSFAQRIMYLTTLSAGSPCLGCLAAACWLGGEDALHRPSPHLWAEWRPRTCEEESYDNSYGAIWFTATTPASSLLAFRKSEALCTGSLKTNKQVRT